MKRFPRARNREASSPGAICCGVWKASTRGTAARFPAFSTGQKSTRDEAGSASTTPASPLVTRATREAWALPSQSCDTKQRRETTEAYLGKRADTIILVRAFASLGQHAVASKLAEKGRGWNKMMEKIIANVMVEISLMVTIVIDDVA